MQRLSLKQMILNKLELNKQDKKFIEDVLLLSGYSNIGNFKKVLRDESKDIEKLDGFLKVAKMIFADDSSDLIVGFVESLNPDTITMRLMLEYATLYGQRELKYYIIDKLKSSSNKESKEWAFVYEIDDMIELGQIGVLEGLNLLNSKKYSKSETKAYSKIAQLYCYYDMRNIQMLEFAFPEVEEDMKKIKNDFIRNSYIGRVFGLKVDINLHSEAIGELIQNIFVIDNAPDPVKGNVYLQIGNSYMLKSFDKAIKFYKMGMEIATPKTKREIARSINFTSLLWDKTENFIEDNDITNELFYYIKTGNKKEANRLLNKINIDELTDHAKGFNYYYRGLLFNDTNMFYKSIEYFNNCNEKFYKRLPIQELKKMGENEVVLNALSA